jgi:nucleotide-binding universal stress UspA family protein
MKILLPIDGSDHSVITIDEFLSRLWPAGTQVEVLSVAVGSPELIHPEPAGRSLHSDSTERERQRAEKDVAEAADKIRHAMPSLEVFAKTMDGAPADGILKEAKEWGANLIMMGSRGHNAVLRMLLGSVAQAVVRNAPCSVELVRKPATETAKAS